ncbi:hypothetical protein MESS2_1570037 [Mesorhizobium metallidurans STM 2683]|uniref:Uncharacterized protein n=1 Tax=Mesorhizobium metallidurans STM 2683 TaxID=1297569 RepID=M5EM99_9HYPH|nr:hypothetical protein [Mesorhizobium metallidurans]CCV05432.1 hypothetical protein MESS2_1570037 [Mesorhizobium metallidurans STM 2683]
MHRETVDTSKFNAAAVLPYQLRLKDFEIAMQDVYDFFHDVNNMLWIGAYIVSTTCFGQPPCPV